jgi:aromatic ring-opening dioxygenase catalytic subunit (LigB family)
MLVSPAILAPPLPTFVLDEHRRHQTPMLDAFESARARLRAERVEVVVALSARWTTDGPFLVGAASRHRTITGYSGFGVEVRYDCNGQPALARALVESGRKARLRVGPASRGVDSGVVVPLHFLFPERDLPVVPLSVGDCSRDECRMWGAAIRATLSAWPGRVAFVVGGLLTFNEHAWTLNRDVPEGPDFDRTLMDKLETGAWSNLGEGDAKLRERVHPDAELRHLEVLRGVLGADVKGLVRCYQASPGAGAALVEFEVPGVPSTLGVT